jgi:hypothetical protein
LDRKNKKYRVLLENVMESNLLEDIEEDGRHMSLYLEGMIVETLGPATRVN